MNNNEIIQLNNNIPTINFKEAMSLLRVSRSTLYRMMGDGKIVGWKVGVKWRFYLQDIKSQFREVRLVSS